MSRDIGLHVVQEFLFVSVPSACTSDSTILCTIFNFASLVHNTRVICYIGDTWEKLIVYRWWRTSQRMNMRDMKQDFSCTLR